MYNRGMRFATDEFYHIVGRGVDGRIIFSRREDYERFLKGLREFNTPEPKELRFCGSQNSEVEPPEERERLVDVVSYCLMKNHIHLLIRVIDPQSMAKFLQKLFGGYTMYFNIKYKRKGVLFQGKAKAQHIDHGVYLDHVLHYIHLNPLDYHDRRWREHGIKNSKLARQVVVGYLWSSIREIFGEEENLIINRSLVKELVASKRDFFDGLLSWAVSGGSTSEVSEMLE